MVLESRKLCQALTRGWDCFVHPVPLCLLSKAFESPAQTLPKSSKPHVLRRVSSPNLGTQSCPSCPAGILFSDSSDSLVALSRWFILSTPEKWFEEPTNYMICQRRSTAPCSGVSIPVIVQLLSSCYKKSLSLVPPGSEAEPCIPAFLRHLKDESIRKTGWWFGTFFIFPYIWNNHPNWLSYFSEGWPNHQPEDLSLPCQGWNGLTFSPHVFRHLESPLAARWSLTRRKCKQISLCLGSIW